MDFHQRLCIRHVVTYIAGVAYTILRNYTSLQQSSPVNNYTIRADIIDNNHRAITLNQCNNMNDPFGMTARTIFACSFTRIDDRKINK